MQPQPLTWLFLPPPPSFSGAGPLWGGGRPAVTLCLAYLMRKEKLSADTALARVQARRSVIQPNGGFWRTLCTLEGQLGVAKRSDPNRFSNFHGLDYDPSKAAPADGLESMHAKATFVPASAGGDADRRPAGREGSGSGSGGAAEAGSGGGAAGAGAGSGGAAAAAVGTGGGGAGGAAAGTAAA